jgi:hypothetical protein
MRILTKISRVAGYLVMFGIFGKQCIVNAGLWLTGGFGKLSRRGALLHRWLRQAQPPGYCGAAGFVLGG